MRFTKIGIQKNEKSTQSSSIVMLTDSQKAENARNALAGQEDSNGDLARTLIQQAEANKAVDPLLTNQYKSGIDQAQQLYNQFILAARADTTPKREWFSCS